MCNKLVLAMIFIVFLGMMTMISNIQSVKAEPSDLVIDGTAVTLFGNLVCKSVRIINGGTLYVATYNGTLGTGLLNLTVTDEIFVDVTSRIICDGRGYGGGNGGSGCTAPGDYGWQGESYQGTPSQSGSPSNNHGGGGGGMGGCTSAYSGGGGGGGAYGGNGGSGAGTYPGGYGGTTYGLVGNYMFYLGSGGGGGGVGGVVYDGARGGAGGGALIIKSSSINIKGTVSANGEDGHSAVQYGGNGGGGSGGTILLDGTTINITGATITANGGAGGTNPQYSYRGGPGGNGGGGRIKIFYGSLQNSSAIVRAWAGHGGNDGSTEQNGTIYYEQDLMPPTIVILSPQNETYYSDSVPMTLKINEPTSWIGYSLDDQVNVTITGNTIINVEDGPHYMVVYANDTAGNMGSSQAVYFTVNSSLYEPWETSFIGLGGYPIVGFAVCSEKLYAAADNMLYVYDGNSWNMIDAPTFVVSLKPYQDKLVVGGHGGLYSFDGSTFNLVFAVPTYIKVLGIYNNTFYAGTILDKPPTLYYCNGSVDNPADWHVETGFSSILNFSGPFGSIESFEVYNNLMYVASGSKVYAFDGTGWSIAKTYDDVYAFLDMEAYDDKLYLATRDQAWRKPYYQGGSGFSGRVIEFDEENWTTIFDHDYWLYSLEAYDDKLYVGTANKIYTCNGTDWQVSFNAVEGAYYAISMITYNGKIYVGMGNGYMFEDPLTKTTNPEAPVVPEFPSLLTPSLFMIVTLLAVIVYRKKLIDTK